MHVTGTKHFHHPVVGELHLAFNTLPLPGGPGLTLTGHTRAPTTGTDERLTLLASWATTPAPSRDGDQPEPSPRSV